MKSNLVFFASICASFFINAQGNSPFSYFGPGTFLESAFQSNFAKSGLGVSSSSKNMLNPINPATYSNLTLTTGETGIYSSTNFIQHAQSKDIISNSNLSGFGLGLPLGNRFGGAFGLTSLSKQNYSLSYFKTLNDGSLVEDIYEGSGGLSKLFLGIGTAYKKISVGVNGHYIFGRLDNTAKEKFSSPDYKSIRFQEYTNVSGFNFNTGLQFKQKFNTNNYFILGTNFDFGGIQNTSNYLVANYFTTGQATTTNNKVIEAEFHETTDFAVDTRESPIQDKITLPSTLQTGCSIGKSEHWEGAIEYKFRTLSSYEINGVSSRLNNTNTIIFGGNFIPNKKALGRSNYWKTVVYNLGMHLGNSGVVLSKEELSEFGINFGFGLPLKKFKYQTETFGSSIYLSFGYLNRSNTAIDVTENYLNINASVVLNDKWFIKRKFK
jgi:hypothetical protein